MHYDERFYDTLKELLIPVTEDSLAFKEHIFSKGLEKQTIKVKVFKYFSSNSLSIYLEKKEDYYSFIDKIIAEKAQLLFPLNNNENYFNNLLFVLKCSYNQYFLTELNLERVNQLITLKKDIIDIITNLYENEIDYFKITGFKTRIGVSSPLTIKFLIDSIAFAYFENKETFAELDNYDEMLDYSDLLRITFTTTLYDLLMLIDREGNLGITDFINAKMENSHSDKQLELVFDLLAILGLIKPEKITSEKKDYIRSHLKRDYLKNVLPLKEKMAIFFASGGARFDDGQITMERTIE